MDRIEHDADTTDLGAASIETRGGDVRLTEIGGKQPAMAGIGADD